MSENFSPSINIIRDADKKLRYIPTSNSKNVYRQISDNFKSGFHSFNIIGSYGTGKSAFLVAFLKHLSGEEEFFTPVNGQFNGCKKFKFYNVIGKSDSLISSLAKAFTVENSESAVLKFLQKEHKSLKKKDTCLVLLIDEFGKFLEFAAKNNPEKELYFIQKITEYANGSDRNILFLSTMHQNLDAYAVGLSETQKNEWEKVKGRLKELTFNEPVEQLLQLASETIKARGIKVENTHSPKLLSAIQKSGVFNLLKNIEPQFAKRLYPFDLLSAMVLTLSLQRYGQNERSLFNFLETNEHHGLNTFLLQKEKKEPFYNLDKVYDYLEYNYYSELTSKYNPDFFRWTMLRNSLERVEVEIPSHLEDAQKLVKTIGLLDIFSSTASKVNTQLLVEYSKSALSIQNAEEIITLLEDKKIIRYQSFKEKYKLFEGTDVDIEQIQRQARKEIGKITNLVSELRKYFQLSFVPAKSVSYIKGTPRIFEYILSEHPVLKFDTPQKGIDGFVNLIFPETNEVDAIECTDEPILHGVFSNAHNITEQIQEIRSIEKALTLINDDVVAYNELRELMQHMISQLDVLLNEELFSSTSPVDWYFEGKAVEINSKRSFNSFLSKIINKIYPETPVFKNELMNKTKVSGSIHTAKRFYIEALIKSYTKVNLDFPNDKNPPQKTIYFTLLKQTGLHQDNGIYAEFTSSPKDASFIPLWNKSLEFLESAKLSKRFLSEFVNILREKPLGLKEGFIEFWINSFLFIKKDDFALFRAGKYIPRFTKEVMELFMRDAQKYEIKTFDVQGVRLDLFNKYRELTQQKEEKTVTNQGFQETARPFLTFYKDLSKYAQNTSNLSHDTIAFRQVLKNAKELEKTFFEDLPASFGLNISQLINSEKDLDEFITRINIAIKELGLAESELFDRIELNLLSIFGLKNTEFKKYQAAIQKRYSAIKIHLLNERQKTFFNRLNSKIPDKKSWLDSLINALIGKQLNTISDKEERIVIDRFKITFSELDNLIELSKIELDEVTEEAFRIEITGTDKKITKKNVILSKEQKKELKTVELQLRKVIEQTKNKEARQAVLIMLLKEYLE